MKISVNFLFKFELDVDSFGWRRGIDDSEVVSAIAVVLNSPANSIFLYKIALSGLLLKNICFFRLWCIRLVEKSIPNATFIISKYHMWERSGSVVECLTRD